MPRNDYSSAQLISVFVDVQNGACSHSKCMDRLIELHFKDSERFKRDFSGHLNRILVVAGDKRDENIDRLVHLVIDFASGKVGTEEDSHYKRSQFAIFVIQHLLDKTNVRDKSIRFRASHILTGILQCLTSDIEIDGSLQELIVDTMLERSRDKLPAIRCFAVVCLSTFQTNISVMTELGKIMDCDTNKDVRKAALSHVRVSKHTLPSILRRTRDVKEDIRTLALEILTKKVELEKFTPRQLCELVGELVKGKIPGTKEVTLLKNWLAGRFGNDVMKLCGMMLATGTNDEVAEEALKKVIEVTSLAPPYVLSMSARLDDVTSFYWRVYCQHLKSEKSEAALDEILPTLSEYCDIIREYAPSHGNTKCNIFMFKQLLLGCPLFDRADEAGRSRLVGMLGSLLTTAPLDLLELAIKSLCLVESEEAECIRMLVESISELKDPLEEDAEIKQCKDKLSELQEKASRSEAETNQMKIIESRLQEIETKTWLRCCTITEQLLKNINKGLHNPMIDGLFHSIILPSVQHQSPDIRNLGFQLLGLFCLFDKEKATRYATIFIQAVSRDTKDIKITALKVLFDFLLAFNLDDFSIHDSQQASPASQSISEFQRSHLESKDEELRTTCVEGFAKLMLAGVVADKTVFAQLLEQLFSPATVTMPKLRQCLHIFFLTYLHPKRKVTPAHAELRIRLTRKAIFLALKRFIYTPSSIEGSVTDAANFMLNLLRMLSGKDTSPEEGRLAVKLLRQLHADPNGVASPILCKILRLLQLSKSKLSDIDFLKEPTRRVISDVEDKFVATTLEKFLQTLQELSPVKSGSEKPSEPASPSPPSSPFFTSSPQLDFTDKEEVRSPENDPATVVITKKEMKSKPLPKKQQKLNRDAQVLGDYLAQQKRAFAELDNFPLEAKKSGAPTSDKKGYPRTPAEQGNASPHPPHTVPRAHRDTPKHVKFQLDATPVKDTIKRKAGDKDIVQGKEKQQKVESPKKNKFVLSFTSDSQDNLRKKAADLQMICSDSDVFDSSITHVVSPQGKKSIKTITARLAGLWVVDPKWLEDSEKAGKILPEFKYGTKQQNCLFENKKFGFAPSFLSGVSKSNIHNCKTFILLGRGSVVEECKEADYVMVKQEGEEIPPNCEPLTLKQFFSLLQL